jgi:hypothetical protein
MKIAKDERRMLRDYENASGAVVVLSRITSYLDRTDNWLIWIFMKMPAFLSLSLPPSSLHHDCSIDTIKSPFSLM